MEERSPNTGDEVVVKSRQKRRKLLEEQETEELRQLLDTPGGRWFIWRLLSQCGLFDSVSMHDAHKMAISSGKRDIGIWTILKVNEADRNGYRRLMDEAKERDIDAR